MLSNKEIEEYIETKFVLNKKNNKYHKRYKKVYCYLISTKEYEMGYHFSYYIFDKPFNDGIGFLEQIPIYSGVFVWYDRYEIENWYRELKLKKISKIIKKQKLINKLKKLWFKKADG